MELLLCRALLVEVHRQTRHLTLLINYMAVLFIFFLLSHSIVAIPHFGSCVLGQHRNPQVCICLADKTLF